MIFLVPEPQLSPLFL